MPVSLFKPQWYRFNRSSLARRGMFSAAHRSRVEPWNSAALNHAAQTAAASVRACTAPATQSCAVPAAKLQLCYLL